MLKPVLSDALEAIKREKVYPISQGTLSPITKNPLDKMDDNDLIIHLFFAIPISNKYMAGKLEEYLEDNKVSYVINPISINVGTFSKVFKEKLYNSENASFYETNVRTSLEFIDSLEEENPYPLLQMIFRRVYRKCGISWRKEKKDE